MRLLESKVTARNIIIQSGLDKSSPKGLDRIIQGGMDRVVQDGLNRVVQGEPDRVVQYGLERICQDGLDNSPRGTRMIVQKGPDRIEGTKLINEGAQ